MSDIPLKKDCFVTSLALMGVKKLGLESLEWEPEIVRDAFEAAYGLEKLPQRSFDKLNCGYMLIGTDAFTSTIEGFLSATAVMNNMVFDESEVPFCTLEMCAWSIWEYINLLGDMKNGAPTDTFSPDIVVYLQEAGKLNGISKFPVWMRFAEPPEKEFPDMSGDLDVFEMYNARQQDFISDINGFVANRQKDLAAELKALRISGILG